jgi:hypothetical protein
MDRHVSVSLLTDRLTSGAGIFSRHHVSCQCPVLCAHHGGGDCLRLFAKTIGDVSMDLQIPKYPFAYIIAFGAAVLVSSFSKNPGIDKG